jgi:uncharacterized membrane protein
VTHRNLLIAIVAAGALVRFATLGSQGYWFDEVFSVTIARTAMIPVVYAAGSALSSQRAGVAAAAITAASPLMIWYSQEARAYALLVLLSTLSFLFFASPRSASHAASAPSSPTASMCSFRWRPSCPARG